MTARVEVAACEAQPVVSIPRDHGKASRRYASVASRALADGMPGLAAGYRLLAEAHAEMAKRDAEGSGDSGERPASSLMLSPWCEATTVDLGNGEGEG